MGRFFSFYEATGRATAAWQKVEDAICDVFTRAVICSIAGSMLKVPPRSALMLGGIFYSSTNFRGRLDMVTRVLDQINVEEALLKEWSAIVKKADELYLRRNIIAHGHVWGNKEGASSVQASLLDRKARKSLTYVQVCQCEQSFSGLADRSTHFAIALNKSLVS
ncbi:MAG TPA: hypothetical protein VHA35_02745 [Dongiaceae bacterium]|nr:hypothetical protein [Dongiaceae bacterium]